MKNFDPGTVQNSYSRKFIFLLIFIVIGDILTHILTSLLPEKISQYAIISEAIFFIIVVSPILYLFFYRPHQKILSEHEQTLRTLEIKIEDLNKSERQYRSLFEASLDAVMLTAPDGRILAANVSACGLFERTEAELIEVGRIGLMDESDSRWSEALEVRKHTGKFVGELSFKRKNGNTFPAEISSRIFTDINNNVLSSMVIRDITKRIENEEALRINEHKYRQLVENLQEGIWVIDKEADTVLVNTRLCEILGYSKDEMIGKSLFTFVEKEQFTRTSESLERRKNGIREHRELSMKRKNGEMITISLETYPVFDNNKIYNGAVAAVTDITEQKQVFNTLFESEERYRQLVLTSPAPILVHQNGLITFVNNAALIMFGAENEDELLGTKVIDRVHPEFVEIVKQRVKLITKENQKAQLLEEKLLKLDGTIIYAEVAATQIILNGMPAVQIVLLDVTDRKLQEEMLKKTNEEIGKLFLAVEQNPTSIVITDDNGTIEYVNPKFTAVTGYTLDEARGKTPRILKSGESTKREYEILWKTIKSGKEWKGEFHNRRKDGSLYWERASIAPVKDMNGKTTHFIAIKEDVTERKQSEAEIISSRDQLRQLALRVEQIREEERTTIAREIHDELGQNLTGLKMKLTWLSKKLVKDQLLQDQVLKMRELVDITIQEVRRIATELRPGVLDELGLGAAMTWHGKKFEEESGIECLVSISPEIDKLSQQYSTALFRIFQESLTNVGRYAEATLVKTKLSIFNDMFWLEITDNGIGIDDKKLTDPTSIGLLGMKERVLALGGTLTIKGAPKVGTTITATIPVKQQ